MNVESEVLFSLLSPTKARLHLVNLAYEPLLIFSMPNAGMKVSNSINRPNTDNEIIQPLWQFMYKCMILRLSVPAHPAHRGSVLIFT